LLHSGIPNENYGWHTIRNWIIQGPNVAFPNSALELAGTSTGAAINCDDGTTTNAAAGYNLTIDNVELKQFYAGLNFRAVLLAKIYALKAFFNQYGVLVDGGQTNAIDLIAPSILDDPSTREHDPAHASVIAITMACENEVVGVRRVAKPDVEVLILEIRVVEAPVVGVQQHNTVPTICQKEITRCSVSTRVASGIVATIRDI